MIPSFGDAFRVSTSRKRKIEVSQDLEANAAGAAPSPKVTLVAGPSQEQYDQLLLNYRKLEATHNVTLEAMKGTNEEMRKIGGDVGSFVQDILHLLIIISVAQQN